MIEVILLGIIAILAGLLGWEKRESRAQINKLINALLAKSAQDMANLDLIDKTTIKVDKPKEPDFISEANLSQEDWEKVI